jgi:hypothetical protein
LLTLDKGIDRRARTIMDASMVGGESYWYPAALRLVVSPSRSAAASGRSIATLSRVTNTTFTPTRRPGSAVLLEPHRHLTAAETLLHADLQQARVGALVAGVRCGHRPTTL